MGMYVREVPAMSFYIDLDGDIPRMFYKTVGGKSFELPREMMGMKEVKSVPETAIQLTERKTLEEFVMMVYRAREAMI